MSPPPPVELAPAVAEPGSQDASRPFEALSAPTKSARMDLSAWTWAFFEGGRDPYLILVAIYIFLPYFTSVIVGDPVRGQAIVAGYAQVAALVVAATAPILGAMIDQLGGRKPALLVVTFLSLPLLAALWWARPDGSGLSLAAVVVILASLNVLFSYSGVIHNALLVPAAGRAAGKASGMAMMLANVLGILSLGGVLWAFALPGLVSSDLLPKTPLFGLDPAAHEPDRIVAPIAALLLLLGAVPLAIFTRDQPGAGGSLGTCLAAALRDLRSMPSALKGDRNIAVYLIVYMIIADAIGSIALFIGVYAAGVMSWGVVAMLLFAIWQSVAAGSGGFLAGSLDERLGSKRTLQFSLAGALVATLGLAGMAQERILYLWHAPADIPLVSAGPLALTTAETVFILLSGLSVMSVAAAASAARVLLIAITPPERTGAYFGVFALSGRLTAWLGPMLVALFTAAFQTQQAGFAPVAVLFLAGLVGLQWVRATRTPQTPDHGSP